jgi:hypothetical protein
MKICKTCKTEKQYSEYGTSKYSKDGYEYVCKSCRAEYERQRREKKGVVLKLRPKIIDDENKECLMCHEILHIDKFQKAKRGRLGRKSYCIVCTKQYHRNLKKNPEFADAQRKRTQKYRNNHREHWRGLHRINSYNRRNLEKAKSDGTITEEFMRELYATEICCWCKKNTPISERTAEHIIPLSKGGIHGISNLKMACLKCNSSKLNF